MKHGSSIFARRGSIIPNRGSIFLQRAQISPYETKATSKIMEYRQRLFVYNTRRSLLNAIEVRRLSRPKSLRSLSSDRLETKYESCEK